MWFGLVWFGYRGLTVLDSASFGCLEMEMVAIGHGIKYKKGKVVKVGGKGGYW